MANTVTINVRASDKASSEIDKIKNRFETLTTGKGFKTMVTGVGLGVGAAAFGALTGAIDVAISKLGEAAEMYREDQASQALLAQALTNNIPAWNGNTAAVEAYAAAQGRLGFADDEVRASLGQLVGVTHDLTTAQELNTIAQDLARAKGIDLATATDIVTKAHEGNGRALKGLGIDIGGASTAAELLDALQKNVNGSAETWANTNEGKLAVSNVRVGEAMERVGEVVDNVSQVVIPIFATVLEGLIQVLSDVWEAVKPIWEMIAEFLQPAMEALGKAIPPIWDAIKKAIKMAADVIMAVLRPIIDAIKWVIDNLPKANTSPEAVRARGIRDSNPFVPATVPGYAEGGIVPGAPGAPLLAVVHGGERIIPTGGAGGSGLVMTGVTINVSGAQDPASIARDILQSLKREVDRQGVALVPG